MLGIIKILFKTQDTFERLYDQWEVDLNIKCNLIYMLNGASFIGLTADLTAYDNVMNYLSTGQYFILYTISLLFGAFSGLLINRYLVTYILFGIGKLVKAKGEIIDYRVVIAYALVPSFLLIPYYIYKFFSFNAGFGAIEYWVIISIITVLWFWSMKILIQGLMQYNEYRFYKALINCSPLIIIGLLKLFLEVYYKF